MLALDVIIGKIGHFAIATRDLQIMIWVTETQSLLIEVFFGGWGGGLIWTYMTSVQNSLIIVEWTKCPIQQDAKAGCRFITLVCGFSKVYCCGFYQGPGLVVALTPGTCNTNEHKARKLEQDESCLPCTWPSLVWFLELQMNPWELWRLK